MTSEEIFAGVCECIGSALSNGAKPMRMEDRIIDDLGADSLDLLDLVFQLEQRFGVSIPLRGIERRISSRLNGEPLEVEGVYTPAALAELRRAMPEVPPEELSDGLTTALLPRRFRVATMVNLVSLLLEEKQ